MSAVLKSKQDYRVADLALADWNRCLNINPQYARVHFAKAVLLDKYGTDVEALEAYKSFLRFANPQDEKRIKRAQARIKILQKGPVT